MKKILLTSVCRPFGPKYGDAPTVGYETLHAQVTRAQGIFSPRTLQVHFSLEYIAENLDAPTVVLQYPSRADLIRELTKGYDYIGVSFLMAVFHKMKDVVALVRRYSPQTKIVLGGYGTVLSNEVLEPYADYICREEGVAFFRKLLREPPLAMPYKHPLIMTQMKIFSLPVSRSGTIFAGLGCANGCDFCCTSHFFGRKHIKLLPRGQDIYAVIERYLDIDPNISFTILDEDFLLNKRRALEFRDCVLKGGKPISVFAFSSMRALSQYHVEEIMEMGIDGFWIGYEGTRSGFAKQQGRPANELFTEFREHGITILTSMIVGFDYQDQEVVDAELNDLLELKPCFSQFLIYGPSPGTPFYERVMSQGLLHDVYVKDPDKYYRKADGFTTMIKHPRLKPADIEMIQRRCFKEDFRRLGPSIYRVIDVWLNGYRKLKDSPNPFLRTKAQRFARDVRKSYPIFLAGWLLGPTPEARRWVGELQKSIWKELGHPTLFERFLSVAALGAAVWTGITLKLGLFQHPKLTRTAYRMPEKEWNHFELWQAIPSKVAVPGLSISVELQHSRKVVWLRLNGNLSAVGAEALWAGISDVLAQCKSRLILDFKKLQWGEGSLAPEFQHRLSEYSARIRLVLPRLSHAHPELLLLAKIFRLYQGVF